MNSIDEWLWKKLSEAWMQEIWIDNFGKSFHWSSLLFILFISTSNILFQKFVLRDTANVCVQRHTSYSMNAHNATVLRQSKRKKKSMSRSCLGSLMSSYFAHAWMVWVYLCPAILVVFESLYSWRSTCSWLHVKKLFFCFFFKLSFCWII